MHALECAFQCALDRSPNIGAILLTPRGQHIQETAACQSSRDRESNLVAYVLAPVVLRTPDIPKPLITVIVPLSILPTRLNIVLRVRCENSSQVVASLMQQSSANI